MGKHTPGPWEANRTGAHSWLITTHNGHRYVAAIAAYLDSTSGRLKEHDTNARLIAAAPDMQAKIDRLESINADLLEALGYLVKMDRRDNSGDPDMTATDAWRHEAWRIAYELVGETQEGES